MNKTCYSLFSGCGGSDTGMAMAGYTPSGGIEWHQPAADIYNANHSTPVTVANILDVDRIPSVDLLWASPVCTRFSLANPNRGENELDIKVARHIANLITQSRPRHIAIENVRAYRSSQSLAIIWAALENAGYLVDDRIYNAANYGAPSTRERLIVRATLEKRLGEVVQTHRSPRQAGQDYGQLSLFGWEPLPRWISWRDAVKDRYSHLPRMELTENQKTAIAPKGDSPLLIERVGYYDLPKLYPWHIPAPTIRSSPSIDDKGSYRVSHNIFDNCDCYAADIICLADWQSFPRSYQWGTNRGEAGRAIGNAVPPLLSKSIAESFI